MYHLSITAGNKIVTKRRISPRQLAVICEYLDDPIHQTADKSSPKHVKSVFSRVIDYLKQKMTA